MKHYRAIAASFAILLLASCGKADVQSTCYKNGDHANMSDGRITRICMCFSDRMASEKLTVKEESWVIAMLNKDGIDDLTEQDKPRYREVVSIYNKAKDGCFSLK